MENIHTFIGSLIHLTYTRPDLSYSVSALSQFSNAPCQVHWQAAIPALLYLAGSNDYSLSFKGGIELIGYANVDWAEDADTRLPMSGYCFLLGYDFMEVQETKFSFHFIYKS